MGKLLLRPTMTTELDYDTGTCDKCGEDFPNESLYAHDDGNLYCGECCYMTKEDKLDALVDGCDV